MIRYFFGRTISGIIAFLTFTVIVFFAFSVLIPYDYERTLAHAYLDPRIRFGRRSSDR